MLGVLAGDRLNVKNLAAWAGSADVVLAADGGADSLLSAGFTPHITVGDLDSLSTYARGSLERVEHDPDQESSDCDKLLALCARLGHHGITLTGAEGRRVDHMLAALQSAARSELEVSVAYEAQWALALRGPGHIRLGHTGTLSLLPLTACSGVTLRGVKWPLENEILDGLGMTSLSNVGLGEIEVSIHSGAAVLFLETEGQPRWL